VAHAEASHVLITTDAVGGVWTFAVDLARALRARQLEVSLAVLGPAPSAAQHAELASIAGVNTSRRM
jgi:hypothetical protein